MAARTTCETGRMGLYAQPLIQTRSRTISLCTPKLYHSFHHGRQFRYYSCPAYASTKQSVKALQIEPLQRCSTRSICRRFHHSLPPADCLFLRIRMLRGREPCHPVLRERCSDCLPTGDCHKFKSYVFTNVIRYPRNQKHHAPPSRSWGLYYLRYNERSLACKPAFAKPPHVST